MSDFTLPGSRSRLGIHLNFKQVSSVGSSSKAAVIDRSGNLNLRGGLAFGNNANIGLTTVLTGGYTALYAPDGAPPATTNGIFLGTQTGGVATHYYRNTEHHFDVANASTNMAIIKDGETSLNNATSNWIKWAAAGYAPPAFTTRSVGTKLVLYPQIDASHVDYAIGINSNTLWNSVPDATGAFKWYHGTTNNMTLAANGILNLISATTPQIRINSSTCDMEIGGSSLATGDAVLKLGANRTGSGNSYVDFFTQNPSANPDGRIIAWNSGDFNLYNNSTGDFNCVMGGTNQFKWFSNTSTLCARVDGSGNMVANSYWFNAASSAEMATRITNFNQFYDYDGNGAIFLGGSGDKKNYFRNTAQVFQSIGGAAAYLYLNNTSGFNEFFNNEQRFYTAGGSANCSINSSAAPYPPTDNLVACGFSGLRYTAFWGVNGAIQTSDAGQKEFRDDGISDAELRAIARVKPKVFRMNDQIEKKGDDARWHYGYTTQDWIEAYEAEGLDPWRHGAFCRDLIAENGERFTEAAHHEHHHTPPEIDDGIEREYTHSLRYDQCLVLMVEALRREVEELKTLRK